MPTPYKRKTYYIKGSAQSRFTLRFVIASILGCLVALGIFNLLSYQKIDSILYSMRFPNSTAGGLLWREMLYTNIFSLLFIVILFTFTARGLFHRIHGPLKKLTSDLSKVGKGDLTLPINLRENDEFIDIADELGSMVEDLNFKYQDIREATDTLLALCQNPAIQHEEKQQNRSKQVQRSLDKLNNALKAFTL